MQGLAGHRGGLGLSPPPAPREVGALEGWGQRGWDLKWNPQGIRGAPHLRSASPVLSLFPPVPAGLEEARALSARCR